MASLQCRIELTIKEMMQPCPLCPACRLFTRAERATHSALSDRNTSLNFACVDLWDCLKMRYGRGDALDELDLHLRQVGEAADLRGANEMTRARGGRGRTVSSVPRWKWIELTAPRGQIVSSPERQQQTRAVGG